MDNKQNKDGFKERIRINLTMSTRPVGETGFETLTNGEMECNCTNMEYIAFIKDLILGYTKNDSATTLKFLKVLAVSLAEEFEKDETDKATDDSVSYSERETTKCDCDHCMRHDEEDDEIEMKVIQVKNKQQAKKILDMLMGIAKESD
jgi:hypothetical protein